MPKANHPHPQCINLQMMRASHYILKTYDEAYRPYGIRATQMPVLGAVARLAPASIKQVADEMESERSVISRKLQVMEKNGWVREDPKTTGKEKAFILTPGGKNMIEAILPVKQKVQSRIMKSLTNNEQRLLMSLCNKLKSSTTSSIKD